MRTRMRLVAGVVLLLVIGWGTSLVTAASSRERPRQVDPFSGAPPAGLVAALVRHLADAPVAAALTQQVHARAAYVTNALPQLDWAPDTGPVPILVYHDLGTAPATEPWPHLYMPEATFAAEMAWLHAQGYQAVTLDEVMDAWYRGGTLPAKPIVITFDNGYPPQVTVAPRVMSRYGWPGVLNEITDNHLSVAQLKSVVALGWEVDSHSVTHPDMTQLDLSQGLYQLLASRRFLNRTLRVPANGFAYPSSEYDPAVVAEVKAAGYEDATTEGDAYATRSNPYLLPRFEMETGLAQLQADLATPH